MMGENWFYHGTTTKCALTPVSRVLVSASGAQHNPASARARIARRLLFQFHKTELNSEIILDLYTEPTLAEMGSNLRQKQVQAITYWRDFVRDLEGRRFVMIKYARQKLNIADEDPARLADLLGFLTGTPSISPLGFQSKPSLNFKNLTDTRKEFPLISTYALTLHFPFLPDLVT
jgi:hypothetical protein